MTIERPMFPPRAAPLDSFSVQPATRDPATENGASESPKPGQGAIAVIFDLRTFREAQNRAPNRDEKMSFQDAPADHRANVPIPGLYARRRPRSEPVNETALNSRLRNVRHQAWTRAEAATRYWRARMEYEEAVILAQRCEITEGNLQSALIDQRMGLVRFWREALVAQMLTPAWDLNSLKWKNATLDREAHRYIDADEALIVKAIADDEAWLAAHPSKRSNPGKTAERRAFREAMRQRIRDIAAARDIPASDIKSALSLRHQKIGEFVEKHGVRLEWLLEGRGRVFKERPMS